MSHLMHPELVRINLSQLGIPHEEDIIYHSLLLAISEGTSEEPIADRSERILALFSQPYDTTDDYKDRVSNLYQHEIQKLLMALFFEIIESFGYPVLAQIIETEQPYTWKTDLDKKNELLRDINLVNGKIKKILTRTEQLLTELIVRIAEKQKKPTVNFRFSIKYLMLQIRDVLIRVKNPTYLDNLDYTFKNYLIANTRDGFATSSIRTRIIDHINFLALFPEKLNDDLDIEYLTELIARLKDLLALFDVSIIFSESALETTASIARQTGSYSQDTYVTIMRLLADEKNVINR